MVIHTSKNRESRGVMIKNLIYLGVFAVVVLAGLAALSGMNTGGATAYSGDDPHMSSPTPTATPTPTPHLVKIQIECWHTHPEHSYHQYRDVPFHHYGEHHPVAGVAVPADVDFDADACETMMGYVWVTATPTPTPTSTPTVTPTRAPTRIYIVEPESSSSRVRSSGDTDRVGGSDDNGDDGTDRMPSVVDVVVPESNPGPDPPNGDETMSVEGPPGIPDGGDEMGKITNHRHGKVIHTHGDSEIGHTHTENSNEGFYIEPAVQSVHSNGTPIPTVETPRCPDGGWVAVWSTDRTAVASANPEANPKAVDVAAVQTVVATRCPND